MAITPNTFTLTKKTPQQLAKLSQRVLFSAYNSSKIGFKAPLNEHQKAIYDTLAECWQIILQNIDKALDLSSDDDTRKGAKACTLIQFWNAHQRFFNQILFSLQTPAMIQDIEQQLDEGNFSLYSLLN